MIEKQDRGGKRLTAEDRPPPVKVVFATGGQAFQGTTCHFDEVGLLLSCTVPLPVGIRLELELHFKGLKHPIEVHGEVVWSNLFGPDDPLTPRGMGVKFFNLDPELSRMLVDLADPYRVYGDQYRCFYK